MEKEGAQTTGEGGGNHTEVVKERFKNPGPSADYCGTPSNVARLSGHASLNLDPICHFSTRQPQLNSYNQGRVSITADNDERLQRVS